MEPVSFPVGQVLGTPIALQPTANDTETVLAELFATALEMISERVADLRDYGAPMLGSRNVLERMSKHDGLAVLVRSASETDTELTTAIMRAIYASWIGLGSERGLGFLEFVLQMIWPDAWTLRRLWHTIEGQYPRFLTHDPYNQDDFFLTSRIQILLDDSIARTELSELAPVLRRLVPANIVPSVVIDVPVEDMAIGVAVVMTGYQVADLSPFA